MNMFDEAKALAITMKMRNLSQKEMSESLGVSSSYISNKLRLLSLEESVQNEITEQNLTERHARALLRLDNENDRLKVLKKVKEEKLSVAMTEALVDLYHLQNAPKKLSRADGISKTDIFLESLNESIELLTLSGIKAQKKITYERDKIYVTICIKE